MAFIYDSLVVEDIDALKALTSATIPKRVDGIFLAVSDDSTGFPSWYKYTASSEEDEDLPSIVEPTDGIGRYLQFKGGSSGGGGNLILTTSDSPPTGSPPAQSLESGVMYVHFQVVFSYGSPSFTFWVGVDSTGVGGSNGWIYYSNDG